MKCLEELKSRFFAFLWLQGAEDIESPSKIPAKGKMYILVISDEPISSSHRDQMTASCHK